jgi:hypothetical protein
VRAWRGAPLLLLVLVPVACLPTGRTRRPPAPPEASAPESFQALYRFRATGREGTVKARAWVAVDSVEGRLSAEVLGPLGGTRAQLDADRVTTRAFLVEENTYVSAEAGRAAMSAIFGVPLRVEELVELFRGRRPGGGRTPPWRTRGPDGSWEVGWSFTGGRVPSTLSFRGPRGRLELELLRMGSRKAAPPPFPEPAGARHVDPGEFRAMFLP